MFFRIIVRPYSLYLLQHIYLLRGFHSLIDTQLIHSIYQGDFVSTSRYSSTLNGRLPLLLRLQKRSGILSLDILFNLISFDIFFLDFGFFLADFGARYQMNPLEEIK